MANFGKPQIISVDNITKNSLSIRFLPDTDDLSLIKTWTLNADVTDAFFGQYLEVAQSSKAGDRTIAIDRLLPYTKYYLRLFGSSSFQGSTPNSPIVTTRTLPNPPGTTAPTYIDAQGQNGLHYKFNGPTTFGGSPVTSPAQSAPPFTMEVGYGTDPNQVQSTITGLTSGDVFINGLQPYTLYYVWSRAVNAGGASAWSQRYEMRTRAAASNPPEPQGISEVDMRGALYKFADGGTNGPAIDERQVSWTTDPYNPEGYIVSSGQGQFRLGGLSPATTYYVWSRQHTQEGWSMWSARSTFRTVAGARVFLNGQWREAIPFVKVNDSWKWAQPYQKRVGLWKRAV